MPSQTPADPLALRVHSALECNPHLKARQLRFEMHDGRVRLLGVVSSYYQKQMAQESVRRLEGVEAVENQLEVAWG